ncbi:HEAT repeat domain-containing protein [uncultured Croceitalea sp.]|uniref:HEAT repeat domain-containing protein n=1 Tax=uncultured Croceitalea sp. TaxID=1798908 RepID=UPI0033057D31
MEQEEFERKAIEYIRGDIGEQERIAFEAYLEGNPKQKMELEGLMEVWSQTDKITTPEPSEQMDIRFFETLNAAVDKKEIKKSKGFNGLLSKFKFLWSPQFAYGIVLLGIGLSIGYFFNTDKINNQVDANIASNNEAKEVREKLVLTLLEQPSANKRLQGVSEANKFDKVDETVINALLQTLNKDSNVNVRLAAIESLTNYVDNPAVRQGLVQSIPNQESPIVQVTLANLMAALQEKKSVEPFKKLLQNQKLDTTVKKKIESTIQSII